MGIFTRFRDIVNSNINAMLDSAEDPEKMIRLMIHEMEDTLVEIKSSCARAMATCKKVQHQLDDAKARENFWADRAKLAVDKGREDLAREALHEKRRYTRKAESLDAEMAEHNILVEKYQDDIRQLEDKLGSAREKQRLLLQRYIQVNGKKRAQEEIRRMESTEAILKFDEFEDRIDRMEAEAELVNFGKKSGLNERFDELLEDDDIEKELAALKKTVQGKDDDTAQ